MAKILVTGAAGLIGREVFKKLSLDNDVVGVDNNFRYRDQKPAEQGIIEKDLSEFIAGLKNDFNYIFHLAAVNGTSNFYETPNYVLKNNILTDISIFDFAKSNQECKLIYASSSEVISDTDVHPTPEITDVAINDIHNPRWSYRLGKIVSENYLLNSDIEFLIIRFFNVYGRNSGKGHFIRDIIDKINIDDFSLIGADETRSFCYIDDAVNALLQIYRDQKNEVLNIGNDQEITILEAANIILEVLGKKGIEWKIVESRRGSVKRRCPDISKLKKLYETYHPRSFSEGVENILSFIKEQKN